MVLRPIYGFGSTRPDGLPSASDAKNPGNAYKQEESGFSEGDYLAITVKQVRNGVNTFDYAQFLFEDVTADEKGDKIGASDLIIKRVGNTIHVKSANPLRFRIWR